METKNINKSNNCSTTTPRVDLVKYSDKTATVPSFKHFDFLKKNFKEYSVLFNVLTNRSCVFWLSSDLVERIFWAGWYNEATTKTRNLWQHVRDTCLFKIQPGIFHL